MEAPHRPPSLLLQNCPEGMTFQEFVKAKMAPPPAVTPGQKFGQTDGSLFNSLNQRHQKEARLHIMKYLFSLHEKELLENE
jgi:hypothetical protein